MVTLLMQDLCKYKRLVCKANKNWAPDVLIIIIMKHLKNLYVK